MKLCSNEDSRAVKAPGDEEMDPTSPSLTLPISPRSSELFIPELHNDSFSEVALK